MMLPIISTEIDGKIVASANSKKSRNNRIMRESS